MISCEGALVDDNEYRLARVNNNEKKGGLMDECQFDVIYLFEYGCWCWWSATPVPPPAVRPPCPLFGE